MTIFQQRQYNRFERSIGFIDGRAGDFASGSKALSIGEQLKGVVSEFKKAGSEPKAPGTKKRTYVSAKLAALNALREDLVAIARSAEVLSATDAKFKNSFILPDRRRKKELAEAARQFIRDAGPLKADFLGLEMNENFLEQLQTRLDTYEASQSGTKPAAGEPAVSTDALSGFIADGINLVDMLDVVLRNKYRGQTDVLTQWEQAYSLEFTPRRKRVDRIVAAAKK